MVQLCPQSGRVSLSARYQSKKKSEKCVYLYFEYDQDKHIQRHVAGHVKSVTITLKLKNIF